MTLKRIDIMRGIIKIISILMLAQMILGCSAQWHVQRAVLKDPSILEYREVKIDTVIVTKPINITETFTLVEHDTIENVVDNIKYKIIRSVDTFNIEIECPPDTVKVEVVKNIPQVKYIPLTWWQKNRWWIVIVSFIILFLYFYKNKLKQLW